MKKFLLLLGAATALTSSAVTPNKYITGEISVIPEQLLYDGNAFTSVIDGHIITAYNSNWESIATITVDAPQKIEISPDPSYSIPITIYGYTNLYLYGSYDAMTPLTQTFFNDDKKFEYIVPKVRKGIDQWEDETVLTTGYSVMSQDGSKLYDIDIPTEYQPKYYCLDGITAIILDGKKYIVITHEIESYDDSPNTTTSLFYEIDSTGGIKAPKIIKGSLKVSPATPRHGETVNVDLGSETDAATMINVVSANGSTVRSLPIGAGQRNISLPTAGLASGLYIVTVNDHEAAKIIIR